MSKEQSLAETVMALGLLFNGVATITSEAWARVTVEIKWPSGFKFEVPLIYDQDGWLLQAARWPGDWEIEQAVAKQERIMRGERGAA